MKRINAIVKGKGIVNEILQIREKKIKRAVESAIDYAQEQQLDADTRALKAITLMGENADNPENLKNYINQYCQAIDDRKDWETKEEQVKLLKKKLDEEVAEEE